MAGCWYLVYTGNPRLSTGNPLECLGGRGLLKARRMTGVQLRRAR